jgi:glycosyltransferase involved in cell wall biosynthesis
MIWFLREVAPRAPGLAVKIAGNVDAAVRARAPELFAAYEDWFLGRVEDPGAVYANARLVLLPTIGGTGISIKAVEAMSSGLPVVATPQALRGMDPSVRTLEGVILADTAEDFANALLAAAAAPVRDESRRRASATRACYEEKFSLAAYERNLSTLAVELLNRYG